MNNILQNEALLKKILIGIFGVLCVAIVTLSYFAFQQDRTSNLDFDSVTINGNATPLTVPDYSEWICNGFNIQETRDSGEKVLVRGEATYRDFKNRVQSLLDDWRTRRPPPELLAHYTNEKNRLVEIIAVFDDSKLDSVMVNNSEYGLELAERLNAINRRYNSERAVITDNIPEETLRQLIELGCYLL